MVETELLLNIKKDSIRRVYIGHKETSNFDAEFLGGFGILSFSEDTDNCCLFASIYNHIVKECSLNIRCMFQKIAQSVSQECTDCEP